MIATMAKITRHGVGERPLAAKHLVDHVRIRDPRHHQQGHHHGEKRQDHLQRDVDLPRETTIVSSFRSVLNMMANPAMAAAAAGLGNPLKCKWSSSSLVSTLKRANRNAAHAANDAAITHTAWR